MATIPIRFVCISDTYGETPSLPAGDVLIHAGNLTNNGSVEELERTICWLDRAPFKAKLVVAGPRDTCLDISGPSTKHRAADLSHQCPAPLDSPKSLVYLNHEARIIKLETDSGRRVKFKVFGSPYSRKDTTSAFGYEVEDAFDTWSDIPLDTDVCGFAGDRYLREALWRVRPRLVVTGQEFAGRGVEVVGWQLHEAHVKYKEDFTYHLKKPSRLRRYQRYNLSTTARRPLQNDGSFGHLVPLHGQRCSKAAEVIPAGVHNAGEIERSPHADSSRLTAMDQSLLDVNAPTRESSLVLGAQRFGDPNLASICDQQAIVGREGRLETVFVNGAYLPNQRTPGLYNSYRYNQPFIIDVDMPLAISSDA